jgi:shikimate kinase
MNLWLTGFMGAGKTTAGRRLARLLRLPFVDTDVEIEREHGPIAEIFENDGEDRFRALESSLIATLALGTDAVVAVGGGAVLSPENRAVMRAAGAVVHLQITPAGSFARVAHRTHRPLLGSAPDLSTIQQVMTARAAAYADNDHCVYVDGKTPAAVAHSVARWYRRRRSGVASNAR